VGTSQSGAMPRSSQATPAGPWHPAGRTTDNGHQRQITGGANPPDSSSQTLGLCPVYCLKRADMGMVLVRRSTKYRRGAITAPCFSDIEVLAEIFTERWIGTR